MLAILGELPLHPHIPAQEVHIFEAQCEQFGDAEPETGLDDDHCSVAIRHRVSECLHLGHCQWDDPCGF